MEKSSNFIIDGLTNSIVNTISGDTFETDVLRLTSADIKLITKKKGWQFLWKEEFEDLKIETFKLVVRGNPEIIQGLMSIKYHNDHIFMNLIESAPYNLGKQNYIKVYLAI